MNGSIPPQECRPRRPPAHWRRGAKRLARRGGESCIWTGRASFAGFGSPQRGQSTRPAAPSGRAASPLNLLSFELCNPGHTRFVWAVGVGRSRRALAICALLPRRHPCPGSCSSTPSSPIRCVVPDAARKIKSHLIRSFFYEGFMLTLVVGVCTVEDQRSVREVSWRALSAGESPDPGRLESCATSCSPTSSFNALNSTSPPSCTATSDAADENAGPLSDLLRLSLERKTVHEAPCARSLGARTLSQLSASAFGDRSRVGGSSIPRCSTSPSRLHLQPLGRTPYRHGI